MMCCTLYVGPMRDSCSLAAAIGDPDKTIHHINITPEHMAVLDSVILVHTTAGYFAFIYVRL